MGDRLTGGPAHEPAALTAGSAMGALAASSRKAPRGSSHLLLLLGVFLLRPGLVRVFTKTELQKSQGVCS